MAEDRPTDLTPDEAGVLSCALDAVGRTRRGLSGTLEAGRLERIRTAQERTRIALDSAILATAGIPAGSDPWREARRAAHNLRCEIFGLLQAAAGVLDPKVLEPAEAASSLIDAAIDRAQDAEDGEREEIFEAAERIRVQEGLEAVWSLDAPDGSDGFDSACPWPQARSILYEGESTGIFAPGGNPTWLDLYRACDAAIAASGDTHHVFVESLDPDSRDPSILRLSTGS